LPSRGQQFNLRMKLTEGKVAAIQDAFVAACRRSYWRRVWIIQEIVFASYLGELSGTRRLGRNRFGSVQHPILSRRLVSTSHSTAQLQLVYSPGMGLLPQAWPDCFSPDSCRVLYELPVEMLTCARSNLPTHKYCWRPDAINAKVV